MGGCQSAPTLSPEEIAKRNAEKKINANIAATQAADQKAEVTNQLIPIVCHDVDISGVDDRGPGFGPKVTAAWHR